MSKCKVCFDKSGSDKIMSRDGSCLQSKDASCVCPKEGEPDLLTIVAPAVFDECGINLCKVINLPEEYFGSCSNGAVRAIVEVIDIDFNIGPCGSSVEYICNKPNCVKVKLSRIEVTFVIKLLNEAGQIIACVTQKESFLPPECDEDFDCETNPSYIAVEIFAPYGVSYHNCMTGTPNINFIGYVCDNNFVAQGIDVQAIAKVLKLDEETGCAALGLTLYIKSVYQVQYKIPHAGLAVPPKCIPINEQSEDTCMEFVEGDLLNRSIAPLEVATRPRSFGGDGSTFNGLPIVNDSGIGNGNGNGNGSGNGGAFGCGGTDASVDNCQSRKNIC